MIVSIFSPHVLNLLFEYPFVMLYRKCCYKRYKTQYKLNKLLKGPSFDISNSLAQVLVVVFTCYFYTSGMPLLNLICLCTLILTYWCNKTLILRYYHKPPEYSYSINRNIIKILPFAVIFHSIFSLYAYGSKDIFPTGYTKNNTSKYVIPNDNSVTHRLSINSGIANIVLIFISFIVLVFLQYSENIKKNSVKTTKIEDESNVEEITFAILKENGKIDGIDTYEIDENPNYHNLIKTFDLIIKKKQHQIIRESALSEIESNSGQNFSSERRKHNTLATISQKN